MNHVTTRELSDLAGAVKHLNQDLVARKWGKFTVTSVVLTYIDESNDRYFDVSLPMFDDGFNVALIDPSELP